MIATITYFRIKPENKALFEWHDNQVKEQIEQTNCKGYKTICLEEDHIYTVSLWDNSSDMRNFVMSGAHKESMKDTAKMGTVFKSVTIETDEMPNWEFIKEKVHEEGNRVLNLV